LEITVALKKPLPETLWIRHHPALAVLADFSQP